MPPHKPFPVGTTGSPSTLRSLNGSERSPKPVRTCVICRSRRPQEELLRITRTADGELQLGRLRPGRGVYLCPSLGCIGLLERKRVLGRALRAEVTEPNLRALISALSSLDFETTPP